MEKQKGLDHSLQNVDQVVPAADVSQLVNQDRFDLLGGQCRRDANRQQHGRPEHADNRGHSYLVTHPDDGLRLEPHDFATTGDCVRQYVVGYINGTSAQPMSTLDPEHQSQQEQSDADQVTPQNEV